jgi:Domain of unknown function (DUF1707)
VLVMPMPGEHVAAGAAAHSRLRASHADREQVTEVLKTAFVQGRLTQAEFGSRVGRAFTSKTYAELADLTADLPVEETGARAPAQHARARPLLSSSTAISAGAFAMIAALVGLMAAMVSDSTIGVFSATASIAIVGVVVFGFVMAASWQGRAR